MTHREKRRQIDNRRHAERKRLGLCPLCGGDRDPRYVRCFPCRLRHSAYDAKYYARDRQRAA